MPLAQMKWMVRADLPAAEDVEQEREGGVDSRRHGEAGQHHQRQATKMTPR